MDADGQDEMKLTGWTSPNTPIVLHQSHTSKPTSLDLDFRDLSYNTGKGNLMWKCKDNFTASGNFKSGQLIAILGPSGAGKTSLMNILVGIKETRVEGRVEVVTTIHQPSSRLLEYFDHLYIVAGGFCMYQGPVRYLVPYLQSMNLNCPSYHNPVDFAMDVACGQYGAVLADLVSGVQNGRINFQDGSQSSLLILETSNHLDSGSCDEVANIFITEHHSKKRVKSQERFTYAAPFHTQTAVLLGRTWRTVCREKTLTIIRLASHVLIGVLVGILHWFVGSDAIKTLIIGLC